MISGEGVGNCGRDHPYFKHYFPEYIIVFKISFIITFTVPLGLSHEYLMISGA